LTFSQGYSHDIAVSEKVWLGSTDKTTRFGIPWNFMLRDVLQFDSTLDDATNRMGNSHRTCDVIFGSFHPFAFTLPSHDDAGVGSILDGEMRVYDYSAQELLVYDDANYPVYDGHPRMSGLVYVDRHVQVFLVSISSHLTPDASAAQQGHLHERHPTRPSRLH
jgi:hypothetical protein